MDSSKATLSIAYKAYREGDYRRCVDLCTEAMIGNESGDDTVKLLQLLSDAYLEMDAPGEALAVLDRLVILDVGSDVTHGNRGFALLEMKRYGEAAESYRRALGLNPENSSARKYLAESLRGEGNLLEALKTVEPLVSAETSEAEVYQIVGKILAGMNRWDDAYSAFRSALRLDPEDRYSAKMVQEIERAVGERPD